METLKKSFDLGVHLNSRIKLKETFRFIRRKQ